MIMKMFIIIYVLFSSAFQLNKAEFSKCNNANQKINYVLESNPEYISIELCTKSNKCGPNFRSNSIMGSNKYYNCIINGDENNLLEFKIGKVKRFEDLAKMKKSLKILQSDGKFSDTGDYITEFKMPRSFHLSNYEILIILCGKNNEEYFLFQELPMNKQPRIQFNDKRFINFEKRNNIFDIIPTVKYQCISQCGDEVKIVSKASSKTIIENKMVNKMSSATFVYSIIDKSVGKDDIIEITCSTFYSNITIKISPKFNIEGYLTNELTEEYKRFDYTHYDIDEQLKCIQKETKLFPSYIEVWDLSKIKRLNADDVTIYKMSEKEIAFEATCYFSEKEGKNKTVFKYSKHRILRKAKLKNEALKVNDEYINTDVYQLVYKVDKKMKCVNQYMLLFTARGYILPRGDIFNYPSYQMVDFIRKNENIVLGNYIKYSTMIQKLYVSCVTFHIDYQFYTWKHKFQNKNNLDEYMSNDEVQYSIPIEIRIIQGFDKLFDMLNWLYIFPPWKPKLFFPGYVIACHNKARNLQPNLDLNDVASYITKEFGSNDYWETYLTWQATRYISFDKFYLDKKFKITCKVQDDLIRPITISGILKSFHIQTINGNIKYFLAGKDYIICTYEVEVNSFKNKIKTFPQITKFKIDDNYTVSKNKRGLFIPAYNYKRNYSYCCPNTVKFDYKIEKPTLDYVCDYFYEMEVVKYLTTGIDPFREIEQGTEVKCFLCFHKDVDICNSDKSKRKPTRIKLFNKFPNGYTQVTEWRDSVKIPEPVQKRNGDLYKINDHKFKIGCEASSPQRIQWKHLNIGSCTTAALILFPKYKTRFMVGQRLTCGTKSVDCLEYPNKIRLSRDDKIIYEDSNGVKLNNSHIGARIKVGCIRDAYETDVRYIRVESEPSNVIISPKLLYAVAGNFFKCHHDGYPNTEITWIQEDNKPWFRIVENFLLITPYDISGEYTIKCVASNMHGSKENTLTFNVFNPLMSTTKTELENDYNHLILVISLLIFFIIMAFGKFLVMQEHFYGEPIFFRPPIVHVALNRKDFKYTSSKQGQRKKPVGDHNRMPGKIMTMSSSSMSNE